MGLYIIKNEETGLTKGYDITTTLNLVYFDLMQEAINTAPDDISNDEVKALMGGWDIGWYVDFQNELDQISEPLTAGRYTITPVGYAN